LTDSEPHEVTIEVRDAAANKTSIRFSVQYDASLAKEVAASAAEQFLPGQVNIFERDDFQVVTTEKTAYDTVNIMYKTVAAPAANAVSLQHLFLSNVIPFHDSATVRIKPTGIADADKDNVIIKSVSGSKTVVQKAVWQRGWLTAKFRQAGSYQAF
ncbi:hypothetical protein QUS89_22650, partial [Xanthomonas citri pv. citri]